MISLVDGGSINISGVDTDTQLSDSDILAFGYNHTAEIQAWVNANDDNTQLSDSDILAFGYNHTAEIQAWVNANDDVGEEIWTNESGVATWKESGIDIEVISGGAATIGSSDNIATGDYAVALGQAANASGLGAIAAGGAITMGTQWATASGEISFATGTSRASGNYATAMGQANIASGGVATAMGAGTVASGAAATAMGYLTVASGDYSTALGYDIEAGGNQSFAIALNDQNGANCSQGNSMCIMGGKVGIGDLMPDTELHVVGNTTISELVSCDTIDTDANGLLVCGTDANTQLSDSDILAFGYNHTADIQAWVNANDDVGADTQDLSYNETTNVISLVDGGSINISEVDTNTQLSDSDILAFGYNHTADIQAWVNVNDDNTQLSDSDILAFGYNHTPDLTTLYNTLYVKLAGDITDTTEFNLSNSNITDIDHLYATNFHGNSPMTFHDESIFSGGFNVSYSIEDSYWLYQEDANITTITGEWNMGGSQIYDGNWGTEDVYFEPPAYGEFVYIKPPNAVDMRWQIKDSEHWAVPFNTSIFTSCWNYSEHNISLRVTSLADEVIWECWKGWWDWVEWDSGAGVYEEAVWWNITTESSSDALTIDSSGNVKLPQLTSKSILGTDTDGKLIEGTDQDTTYTAEEAYIYLDNTTFRLNTSELNATIDARDSIGIWTNVSGTATYDGNVQVNDNLTVGDGASTFELSGNGSHVIFTSLLNYPFLFLGGNVTIDELKSCDTLDTDANGKLICGTDANTQLSDGDISALGYNHTTDLTTLYDGKYVTTSDDTVSGTELNGLFSNGILTKTGENTFSQVEDNSSNWNLAFGWGNHGLVGYLTTVDISANTNLAVDGTLILTDDTITVNRTWANDTIDARDKDTNLTESDVEGMIFDLDNTGSLTTTGTILASNVFVPAYIGACSNDTIAIGTPDLWYNFTYPKYGVKAGITHNISASVNDIFTINIDGIYEIETRVAFEDTAASPSSYGAIRLIKNDVEVCGSLAEQTTTKQSATRTIGNSLLVNCSANDILKIQFTGGATTVQAISGTVGDNPDSSTVVIKRIA